MREVRKTERFDRWFRRLRDGQAKAKITARIFAIASDHLGDAKGVGEGVLEARIMGKGPGYRIYFILRGSELVVLLAGGDKGSQRADISNAKLEAQALALHETTMAIKLKKWDVQDHLRTPRQVEAFWEAILAESEGDAKVLTNALNEIARSRGMAELARKAGMTRAGLYKALGPEGNPSFASMMRLLHTMKLAPFARAERTGPGARR